VARFGGDEFVVLLEGLDTDLTTLPARPKPWPQTPGQPEQAL
jgi:GGDEF domain-containing protein